MKRSKTLLSYSRYLTAAFAIVLALACPVWLSHAQQKRPAPPPPKPAPQNNNNPFGQLGEQLKQQAAQTTISSLLDNNLPLKLDANAVYPTVAAPPGGPFLPQPLTLTAADLNHPLPPGDYTVNMLAFCTEYSVHRPGAGVAYRLGPLRGKAAGAIGDLLWRGTLQHNLSPQQLQAIAWAIQSGLRYDQMPKTYQSVIDDVVPDHRNELNGDFFQNIEDNYNNLGKGTKLPPLQQMFAGMGKSGQLALSADRQRQALLRQNTSDQIKEQTLFAGQENGVVTPVRAEEGPWTEKIPGVAYLRYQIVGGNMARNNVMQIRILPQPRGYLKLGSPARPSRYAGIVAKPVSYIPARAPDPQTETPPATSAQALIGSSIGCPVGQGAQCLIPVPAAATCEATCAGHLQSAEGQIQVKRGNTIVTLKPGDQINMNDQIITGPGSSASVSFADGTQMTLGEKSALTVDSYVYDPNNPTTHPGVIYNWMEGAFQWISGKLAPKSADRIETGFGTIGIRGTEFVATMKATGDGAEVDLIEGQLDIAPKSGRDVLFNAPVEITFTAIGAAGSPLSQQQYDAAKVRLSPPPAPGVPAL